MLTLRAINWSYASDLNSPPARWSAVYVESGSTGAMSPGESIAESGDEYVRVDVTIDGHTGRLVDGKVREFGFREDPNELVSLADGLDLKADLLDFQVTSARTYRGMQILSGSTAPSPSGTRKRVQIGSNSAGEPVVAAFFESFQTAAQKVVEAAGYTALFDCYDYDLGEDVVWETDRTANDVLASLVAPFNATERFKLDIFVDANRRVRFIERGRSTPAQSEIDYTRLPRREVTRSTFPAVNDVQVAGASYSYVEPDTTGSGAWVEGTPSDQTHIVKRRTVEHERIDINTVATASAQEILVAESVETHYFDKLGRDYLNTAIKNYFLFMLRNKDTGAWVATYPKNRREENTVATTFIGNTNRVVKIIATKFIEDFTIPHDWDTVPNSNPPVMGDITKQQRNLVGFTERNETENFYDTDGVLYRSITKTYRTAEPDDVPTNEPAPTLPGLMLERETDMRMWWSAGTYWRSTTTTQLKRDSSPGPVITTSTVTEPAYDIPVDPSGHPIALMRFGFEVTKDGMIGTWETGAEERGGLLYPFSQGKRQGTAQVKAGPDNAQLRFSFGVLGTKADCEYFRGRIKKERASVRYEATLGLLPNLDIVEGRDLTVLNRPGRWKVGTFYIFSRTIQHEQNQLSMTVKGLGWVDP